MSNSKITILHLSDIHTDSATHYSINRINKISAAVLSAEQVSPSIIAVTGDMVFGGSNAEFEAIEPHFSKLAQDLESASGTAPSWVMVPGNHDGEFKKSNAARNANIEALLRTPESPIDDSVIELCTGPENNYFEFRKKFNHPGEVIFQDRLLTIIRLEVYGKTIQFWEFNVSWTSLVPEQQGKLVFPVKSYGVYAREEVDHRIALLHHPLNWYSQATYHPFREFLLSHFCIVVSGHEHVSGNHQILTSSQDRAATQMISAGALAPHKHEDRSEFQILEIDLENKELHRRVYVWTEDHDAFIEEANDRRTSTMPLRTARQFEIRDEYKEKLEDLGAPFYHPVVDRLRLSDVFIDPLLRHQDNLGEEKTKLGLSLIESESIGKLIFYGDDYCGKTSLLHQIIFRALDLGYVPVLVSAKDISSGSVAERDKLIRNAVRTCYGDNAVDGYFLTPKEKRLLLVDDLDRLLSRADAYIRALDYLNKHTDNYILTVSERFDVSVLGSSEVTALISDLEEHRFLGFSYVLRGHLIERWYALDTNLEAANFEKKVHDAQTHIDAAIGKGLIPSTPFNTLLILQALETTQKSQVVDSSIAQHYDSLLRRRLTDSGAGQKHIDGLYAYLSHLAWWMKQNSTSEIDRTDFERFSLDFSRRVNPVVHGEVLSQLLKARIFEASDTSYRFKYPSSRYFFLAHYIAESIEDDTSLKGLVQHACRHLYVRENANLIVFLTSKIASKWIIREVADVMRSLLSNVAPMDIVVSSKKLNMLVSSTAKLVVQDNDENKAKNRLEYRAQQEQADAEVSQVDEITEVSDIKELDTFAQLNLVFKTGEILGLILKGRFGSLDAELKKSIAIELFEGPLRAVALFLGVINDSPDSLIESLASHLEEKSPQNTRHQAEIFAKKFIFHLVGAYSLALIGRQGSIIGSPELSHVYRELINSVSSPADKENNTENKPSTYKLVEVAGRLSYPGDIPFADIERLAKEFKNNAFAANILQGLVAQHLYMFPVRYDSKQRLANAVNIDLRKQIAHDALKNDEKTTNVFKVRNHQSLIQKLSSSFYSRNKEIIERVLKTSKDIND